jgi:hypothetical protein
VSGAPGTGKTATLTHLLATRLATTDHQAVFINCMVLKSSMAIYREVATQLCPKSLVKNEKEALKVIEKKITSAGPMILLGKLQYRIYYGTCTSVPSILLRRHQCSVNKKIALNFFTVYFSSHYLVFFISYRVRLARFPLFKGYALKLSPLFTSRN